jgi:hypothetical protein
MAHQGLAHFLHDTGFHQPGIEGVAQVVKTAGSDAGPAQGCFPGRLDSMNRPVLEGEDQAFVFPLLPEQAE